MSSIAPPSYAESIVHRSLSPGRSNNAGGNAVPPSDINNNNNNNNNNQPAPQYNESHNHISPSPDNSNNDNSSNSNNKQQTDIYKQKDYAISVAPSFERAKYDRQCCKRKTKIIFLVLFITISVIAVAVAVPVVLLTGSSSNNNSNNNTVTIGGGSSTTTTTTTVVTSAPQTGSSIGINNPTTTLSNTATTSPTQASSSTGTTSTSTPASTPSSSISGTTQTGIGNPLLDISANVDEQFMSKYNIKPANAILAEDSHMPMYDDMIQHYQPVDYTAGGATQNTIRIAQHMLDIPNSTTYIGCIGNDKYGQQLKQSATSDGVNVLYKVVDDTPTGRCAVALYKKDRSLVTQLGAANKYDPSHLELQDVKEAYNKAKYIYSSGYFLTVSPPALMLLAKHVDENNKVLGVNLAAPFIPQFFTQPLLDAIEYADYVFGNESEAEAFASTLKLDDNTPTGVAKFISTYKSKRQHGRNPIAIITQGSKSTIVGHNGNITTYDVPVLDSNLIIDVNGAGDSFVGGFLSQLVLGKNIEQCVQAGHWAARQIIQVSGIAVDKIQKYRA